MVFAVARRAIYIYDDHDSRDGLRAYKMEIPEQTICTVLLAYLLEMEPCGHGFQTSCVPVGKKRSTDITRTRYCKLWT